MIDQEITLKVPVRLLDGLQGNGIGDVARFLEGFLYRVQAEELLEWNEDLEAEEESIAELYADEEDDYRIGDDDPDAVWSEVEDEV